MKSTPLYYPEGDPNAGVLHGYLVQCPGCGGEHVFGVDGEGVIDNEKPTFARELVSCTNDTERGERTLCRFTLKNGRVKFSQSCTHTKAGTEVESIKVAKKVGTPAAGAIRPTSTGGSTSGSTSLSIECLSMTSRLLGSRSAWGTPNDP